MMNTRVQLGQIVIAPSAVSEVNQEDVAAGLCRHAAGDWGECGTDDWKENELALHEGFRLFSVYRDREGVTFWVITEADRSATTILLPSDY